MEKKPFVSFEIDAIPERRPYLLSRDFVFLKRLKSHRTSEPFKGVLFRVVKSTMVLVDFGDDFHSQHSSSNKYDVSFSFNRVCLKRAHQAIAATMGSSFRDVLFPSLNSISSHLILQTNQCPLDTASRILSHKVTLPYLIQGPLSVTIDKLSRTGTVIQQAILKIYRTYPNCRILVCAPTNRSCDALMQSIHDKIPRSMLFRANAAFRDYYLVPDDIIPESSYEGECFTCPSLSELQNFKVITSTYVSSFRLHTSGVKAEHFTHIFLVDASSAVEPEVAVPLANFVGKNSVVVVTGSSRNFPNWVRSDMARKHGLKTSYFERLLQIEPYASRSPMFVSHLEYI